MGLIIFTCKCNEDYVFCSKHRLPSNHDCNFNFKEYNKKKLLLNNPKVSFDKLNKLN